MTDPTRKRPPTTRPRTGSRVAAVQALFQAEQGGTSPEAVIEEFIRHRLGAQPGAAPGEDGFADGRVTDVHVPLFGAIVRAATYHQDIVDPAISAVLPPEWPLERLDPVLRALLRAGTAELSMPNGPPARVVINEYLDVAHGFFDGEEPAMANGVLDRLARQLRPAEFPAPAPEAAATEAVAPEAAATEAVAPEAVATKAVAPEETE